MGKRRESSVPMPISSCSWLDVRRDGRWPDAGPASHTVRSG